MPEQKDEAGEISDKVTVVYLPFTSAQNGAKKECRTGKKLSVQREFRRGKRV